MPLGLLGFSDDAQPRVELFQALHIIRNENDGDWFNNVVSKGLFLCFLSMNN